MAGEMSTFNGTVVTFAGDVQAPLISASYDSTVAEVDVTGSVDTEHTFEPGIINESLTWEVVGDPDITVIAVGDKGTMDVVWNSVGNGSWGTWTTAVITSVSKGGGLGGAVTTSITAKPTLITPV